MSADCLKLVAYFGERDRVGRSFLADRLLDVFDAHGVAASVLMRGAEGFGLKHQLRTDRLLTLSEDLPVVAVAVDRRERIEALLPAVEALRFGGLVTLERARIVGGSAGSPEMPEDLREAAKLTAYIGRGTRVRGRPAHEAALELLHRGGVDGGSVLVGVDGTVGGVRRRARFFSRNVDVPAMVISVGSGERIAAAVAELDALLDRPLMTLERVRVPKRDGELLAPLERIPDTDAEGLGLWQKLMLYSSEHTRFGRHPVHLEAIRRLRREGAAGATVLRGIRGYDGRHPPHGDTFWSLRRRVPTLTVVVDRPAKASRWFALLDEITPERGLITSEIVPAFRASGPHAGEGGLRLATRG